MTEHNPANGLWRVTKANKAGALLVDVGPIIALELRESRGFYILGDLSTHGDDYDDILHRNAAAYALKEAEVLQDGTRHSVIVDTMKVEDDIDLEIPVYKAY